MGKDEMTKKIIKVKRLPKDPGPAAWNQVLTQEPGFPELGHSYPELQNSIQVDWLIIGGGFTGLAAARRLAQLVGDERIALLEAAQLANGPAGRNSGFMIDLPHELNS